MQGKWPISFLGIIAQISIHKRKIQAEYLSFINWWSIISSFCSRELHKKIVRTLWRKEWQLIKSVHFESYGHLRFWRRIKKESCKIQWKLFTVKQKKLKLNNNNNPGTKVAYKSKYSIPNLLYKQFIYKILALGALIIWVSHTVYTF